tara:strand:+ start:23 stop:418 length:396 start_codon:yes stop_codon:yes gene_type:complete
MTIYNNKEAVVAALKLVSTPKPNKLQLRKKRERECIHFMTGIPNSVEGWIFIKTMKKYLHKGRYSIRLKGRGSRKIHGNQSYIPLPHAEHYSVYIDHKIKDRNNPQFYFEKEWKMDSALRRIRDEINQLLK